MKAGSQLATGKMIRPCSSPKIFYVTLLESSQEKFTAVVEDRISPSTAVSGYYPQFPRELTPGVKSCRAR